MKQLPTAKEFYESFTETLPTSQTEEAMIEFAKLHVEQALIEASENVKFDIVEDKSYWSGQVWDDTPLPEITIVKKESILNAYPSINIK
jgi:hypothetical protein